MQPHQGNSGAGGPPGPAVQLQQMQQMQQLQQQMQAQLRQQQAGGQQQAQQQMNSNFGALPQSLPQMPGGGGQFGNMQWGGDQMAAQQRNSMNAGSGLMGNSGGMNNPAFSMMQQQMGTNQQQQQQLHLNPQQQNLGQQNLGGATGANAQQQAQAALYWNALQASNKGNTSSTSGSGAGNSSNLGGMKMGAGMMGNPAAVQAMLHQQQSKQQQQPKQHQQGSGSMTNPQQQLQQMQAQLVAQQMGGSGGQGQQKSASSHQQANQQAALSNAMVAAANAVSSANNGTPGSNMMNQQGNDPQAQIAQLQNGMSGLPNDFQNQQNQQGQGQQGTGTSGDNAQLLMQQHNIIAQLQRQIQQHQQQQGASGGSSGTGQMQQQMGQSGQMKPTSTSAGGTGQDRRTSSSMMQGSGQQQSSQSQMTMLHRGSSSSGMMPMGQNPLQRQQSNASVNSLQGLGPQAGNQQQRGSMKANEQFNLQGLLGGPQGNQQQMGGRGNQLQQQMNNPSVSNTNGASSSYLSNIMGGAGSPSPGAGGNNSMGNSGLSMGNMGMSSGDGSPALMGMTGMPGQLPQKGGMSGQGQQNMDGMRRSMMGDGINQMGKDLTMQQQQQLLMSQMNQTDASGKNSGQQSSQQAMFEQQYKQFQMMQQLQQQKRSGSAASGGSGGDKEDEQSASGDDKSGKKDKGQDKGVKGKGTGKVRRRTSGSARSKKGASEEDGSKLPEQDVSPIPGGAEPQSGGAGQAGTGNAQQSFLDGQFAGGWQSNADLPDRRRVIFSIIKVIERMRPDANIMSQKLPLMAKKLEEHLYRSAMTKEEYVDPSTLKKRLQMIAQGLGVQRSTSAPGKDKDDSKTDNLLAKNQETSTSGKGQDQQMDQIQQLQQLAGGAMKPTNSAPGNGTGTPATSPPPNAPNALGNDSGVMSAQAQQQLNLLKQKQQQQQLEMMKMDAASGTPQQIQGANSSQQGNAINKEWLMQQIHQEQLFSQNSNGSGGSTNAPLSASMQQISGRQGSNSSMMDNLNQLLMQQQQQPQQQDPLKPDDMTKQQAQQLAQQGATPGSLPDLSNNSSLQQMLSQHSKLSSQKNSHPALEQLQKNLRQAHTQMSQQQPSQQQRQSGSSPAMGAETTPNVTEGSNLFPDGDAAAKAQKKKVIRQQQQRLLLLRHASKCTVGPSCKTKFCPQMVTLWKHMKKCREKNCKTAHCLSSRCVLNHYRICKGENRTSSCEICAPVMKHIRLQNAQSGSEQVVDQMEQLAKEQASMQQSKDSDPLFSLSGNVLGQGSSKSTEGNQSINGIMGGMDDPNNQTPVTALPADAQLQMQAKLLQQSQQPDQNTSQQGQQPPIQQAQQQGLQQQSEGRSDAPKEDGQTQMDLQAAQQKLQQQQLLLQQLQQQQAQLLEQQKQLQQQQQRVLPQTQQGQQLQQQQALLQQLQQQFQQQQQLLQQELQRQSLILQQGQKQKQGNQTNLQGAQQSSAQQPPTQDDSGESPQQLPLPTGILSTSLDGDDDANKQEKKTNRRGSKKQQNDHPTSTPRGPVRRGGRGKSAGKGKRLSKVMSKESSKNSQVKSSADSTTAAVKKRKAGTSVDDSTPDTAKSSSTESSVKTDSSKKSSNKRDSESMSPNGTKSKDESEEPPSKMAKVDSSSSTAVSKEKTTGKATSRAKDDTEVSAVESKEESKGEKSPQQGTEEQAASLVPSMSTSSVEQHLESLQSGSHLTPRRIASKCLPVVKKLMNDQYGWIFKDPVDPVELGLPDYFDVVKNPMDLGLVEKKLENGVYKDMEAVESDIKLVFENAILYNGENSDVGDMAKSLLNHFVKDWKAVLKGIKNEQQVQKRKGDACALCGSHRKLFEPTSLYCNGACGMQRIRRNATYYTDHSKLNHWCVPCFSLIKENDPIILDDGSEIKKKDLQKLKNDALPEEAWVQCDDCHNWVHQICALFNGRKNKTASSYCCPKCYIKKKDMKSVSGGKSSSGAVKTSKDLRHCNMSKALEKGLLKTLQKAYEETAKKKGCLVEDVEKAEELSVRVVSDMEKKHVVRDEMFSRYEKKGCPSEFPVRTKCILLFQTVHGVDVLLFGMYVYEYGQSCPAPNRRRVYISYLDSVHYFQPRCYRTVAYHSILVEYLRFVKERGFHTAHIWSCPPSKGDDYIFYCHPAQQLTPRDDMLCAWYHGMLEKAKAEGIVLETRTLYDEYFKNDGMDAAGGPANDPTCLPYFEGDYIPGEIENIINELKNEEEAKRKEREGITTTPGSTHRKIGKKLGTRSNPGQLVNQGRDKVMLRLGLALSNMKQNFIVIHLRSRSFASAVERGDDVSNYMVDDEEELMMSSRMMIGGKDSSILQPERRGGEYGEGMLDQTADSGEGDSSFEGSDDDEDDDGSAKGDSKNRKRDRAKNRSVVTRSRGKTSPKAKSQADANSRSSKFGDMTSTINRHFASLKKVSKPRRIGNTVDEDAPRESDCFDSRQQFLNYCQTNHYQFDELRRAKHTTMMILFHLHNPSAPKFLQTCGACYREIAHGIRYHCNNCSNFDLCQDCYQPVITGLWAQRDARFAHDKTHRFTPIDMEATTETEKSREERAHSIKMHLELLAHAATCTGQPKCSSNNCHRMKKLFEHVRTCKVTYKRGCKICVRLLALLSMHAKQCTERGSCPIPFCDRIRERNKRLRQQQQRMDDRRRQAQNQLYRAGRANS